MTLATSPYEKNSQFMSGRSLGDAGHNVKFVSLAVTELSAFKA